MDKETITNKIIKNLSSKDDKWNHWDLLQATDPDYMLYSPKSVGYNTTAEHQFLMQNLLVGYSPDRSILDIGCGRADLAEFVKDFYEESAVYTGIDHNPIMSDIAKQKYNRDILVGAFETAKLTKHDWVIASGVFTQRRCETETDDLKKLFDDIDILYNLCNEVVSFNLLNPINTYHHEGFLYVHPGIVIDLLIEKYQYVITRCNYSKDVYTVLINKI